MAKNMGWQDVITCAHKTLVTPMGLLVIPDRLSNNGTSTSEAVTTPSDMWIADMNYRVAVQLQANIWCVWVHIKYS